MPEYIWSSAIHWASAEIEDLRWSPYFRAIFKRQHSKQNLTSLEHLFRFVSCLSRTWARFWLPVPAAGCDVIPISDRCIPCLLMVRSYYSFDWFFYRLYLLKFKQFHCTQCIHKSRNCMYLCSTELLLVFFLLDAPVGVSKVPCWVGGEP